MELIDDDGRLFGVVNVIDALVVLLIGAVLVAGAAFVLSSDATEPDARYATVDLGEQPNHIINDVAEGDNMEVAGFSDNLTITDIHYGPGENSRMTVRVAVNGERVEVGEDRYQFQFAGEPFRGGQDLAIETPDYEVTGTIRSVDESGADLQTEQMEVFTMSTMSGETADQLSAGDNYTVDGHEIGTIETIRVYPNGSNQRVALIGFSLDTITRAGSPQFGNTSIRIGSTIPFATDEYELSADVLERGTAELITEDTPVLLESTVPARVAESIDEGDSYAIGDETVAQIDRVETFPTEDPSEVYLLVEASYSTHIDGNEVFFGNSEIRSGASLPFNTGDYDIDATVIQRGAEISGEETTQAVIHTEMSATAAENVDVGDTFTVAGSDVATIEDVHQFPTDDPERVSLLLGIEYRTHQDGDTVLFGNSEIREGQVLPFRTGDYAVSGEIIQRGSSTIETTARDVAIETTVDQWIADDVEVGDRYELAGEDVATVEDVVVYPTDDREQQRLILGLSVETHTRGGNVFLGDERLRYGATMPVRTQAYDLNGEVIDTDALEEPGDATTTDVSVQMKNVPPERADQITEGMTEDIRGVELATITEKTEEPAEVILESEDGDIFVRDHPTNRDLELDLSLETRETPSELRFHGQEIREGDSIVLDLGHLFIEVELINIQE